jgi:hypothetical protein
VITSLEIHRSETLADGRAFGAVGAYVRLDGIARGEVDPDSPANRCIADLAKAPRNARGMVEYETDVCILRPAEPVLGNGRILYEVINRGRKRLFLRFANATSEDNEMRTMDALGDAMPLRMGYTLVWAGWDATVPRTKGHLSLDVPVALENGRPIVDDARDEFVSGTRGKAFDVFRLSYPAASLSQKDARLTVRRYRTDPPEVIPDSGWEFVDATTVRLLLAGTKPVPGSIYDLRYKATDPRVLALGFAATRDVVSCLRHDPQGQAVAGRAIGHALAVGISQSGRFLRDFISSGFNRDESGRRVFDGILAHSAGISRMFFSHRFAQPDRTTSLHQDHDSPENYFPFSTATLDDQLTGRSGSLFRGDGSDPLFMQSNTSTEYWQKAASLLHTDPLDQKDAALPANARVYLIAGTQHGAYEGPAGGRGNCVNPLNPHSAVPVLRALLVALDEWVASGRLPPASRMPRIADGTLADPAALGFPDIPGAGIARSMNRIGVTCDWLATVEPDRFYRAGVSAVDADGNERAGVRTPDVAVPLATYAGWNLFDAPFPEGELADRNGTCLPFAATPEEAKKAGDPRRSLAERYRDRADYVAKVEAAAAELLADRLLLPEDAAIYVARARHESRIAAEPSPAEVG